MEKRISAGVYEKHCHSTTWLGYSRQEDTERTPRRGPCQTNVWKILWCVLRWRIITPLYNYEPLSSIKNDPFFVEMTKLLCTWNDLTEVFDLMFKVDLRSYAEWEKMYFKVINVCGNIERTTVILLCWHWRIVWWNQNRRISLCLTQKQDTGFLFNENYVSSMLTCFSCFVKSTNDILDSSSVRLV